MFLKISQKLHRILGLLMVFLILYITITGFFILHSKELVLYEVTVENPLMLWLYGKPKVYIIDGERIEEEYPPSWEKALVAIHGGKFFGKSFPLVLDVLALSIIIFSITGPYIWYKKVQGDRRRKRRSQDL